MDTKQLKQRILDLAIRGKLVPQDPNDEPASVLLERIRAENEQLIAQGKLKKSKTKSSDKPHYENVPFEIPESWEWVKLGQLYNAVSAKRVLQAEWQQEGVPFYRAREIVKLAQYGSVDNDLFISEDHYKRLAEAYGIPYPNDIMLSAVGTIGKSYIVKNSDRFYYKDASVLCLQNIHSSNSMYIQIVLSSQFVQEQMYDKSKGTTVDTITIEKVGEYTFPLPPLAEQGRIVEAIKQWFELIDQLEQNKQDLQEAIKQTKAKVLDLAIHGKLVPQDQNDEPAIALLRRINPNFKPCDTSHYENLPQGWQVVPMHTLCSLSEGEQQSSGARIYLDVKYLRGRSEPKILSEGKYIPSNSSMILVDGENSGEIFTTNIEGYQGSTFKLLKITNEIFKPFILYVIKSYQKLFRENKVGSAIPHLNKKLFKEIDVLVPPLSEQKRIVKDIDDVFNIVDNISAEL